MKIRIGYGLGTQGLDHAPGDGTGYTQLIDDLERLNFDSVWFSERLTGNAPDPCALMAYTAGRTQRLKMGMSVMVLPGRSPVLVAKELASIALLAGPGRLLPAFGLGAADPGAPGVRVVGVDEACRGCCDSSLSVPYFGRSSSRVTTWPRPRPKRSAGRSAIA